MKKRSVIYGAAILFTLSSQGALAETEPASRATEAKQSAAFVTTTLAGTLLGGPVGMLLGAIGGAYVGEQIKDADAMDHTQRNIARLEGELMALQHTLSQSQAEQARFHQLAMEALETRVLFETASDQLDSSNQLRLQALAKFLRENPSLAVHLDGYADPRGTDEYNNVLSHYRANSVKEELVRSGVDEDRISLSSHGASRSSATLGDHRAYAAERKVELEVHEGGGSLLSQMD